MRTWPFLIIALCLVLGTEASRPYFTLPPLVIYSDGNLDDALATLHALADDEYRVVGICAGGTGFSSADDGAETALRLIESVASRIDDADKAQSLRNIIVSKGSSTPLGSSVNLNTSILNVQAPPIRFLSGNLWGTRDIYFPTKGDLQVSSLSCTEMMEQILEDEFYRITLLSTGTDTDVAQLYRSVPLMFARTNQILRMGGALNVPGNIFTVPGNTVAEFNLYLDPLASDEVLRHDRSFLVPLDATNHVPITQNFLDQLEPIDTLTANYTFAYLSVVRQAFGDAAFFAGYYLWDDLAYQVLLNGYCETQDWKSLSVDTTLGPNDPSGELYVNTRLPGYDRERVCLELDTVKLENQILHWLEYVAV